MQAESTDGATILGIGGQTGWKFKDTSLDYHARNSGDRRLLGESSAGLRVHLYDRWGAAKLDGTEEGMSRHLARIGITGEFWSYARLKLEGWPKSAKPSF